MSAAVTRILLALLLAGSCALATGKPPQVPCEPSLECAWELAKQAGRDNSKVTGRSFVLVNALHGVGHQQRLARDRQALLATLAELQRVKPDLGTESTFDSTIAYYQAAAGLDSEALATVSRIQESAARDSARAGIIRVWAEQGRFDVAFDLLPKLENDVQRALALGNVSGAAVESGREDWIREVVTRAGPASESGMRFQIALHRGEFARAREVALQQANTLVRSLMLQQAIEAIKKSDDRSELAETVRHFAKEGELEQREFGRQVHYSLAIEWLIQAGAFDDALALLPKDDPDDGPRHRAVVAVHRALKGDIAGAEKMLPEIEPGFHANVHSAILTRRVIVGEALLEDAMPMLPHGEARRTALQRIGEGLPRSRESEARAALQEWARRCATLGAEDRDPSLAGVIKVQVKRGFFSDALAIARIIGDTEERLGALTDIVIAQARTGDLEAARQTLKEAKSMSARNDFSPDMHAMLAAALGEANLLDEAYAETMALARRPVKDSWFDAELDGVLVALMRANQVKRAYELAGLLSKHDRGNPHYYLIIASGTKSIP